MSETEELWQAKLNQALDMLNKSAWTQLVDSGLTIQKRLDWQAYRDDLRSIRIDFINPDDVIFPEEPAEE